MAAGKKTTRKKTATKARKTAKKAVSKKKATSKVSKKKVAARKKAGKTSSRKKTSKKKVVKKPSRKRTSKSKVSTTTAKRTKKRATKSKNGSHLIHGIEPYKPRKGEEFMSDGMREHFRSILLAWKQELMQEVDRTVHHMQDEASNFPDPNDRATQESEFGLELRTRDRERKLLKKIAQALNRIDEDSYGYCEETGEEIGLERLEARPVATLCVEAQERRELAERQYSDRDD